MVQGVGFEPTHSYETGYPLEPLPSGVDLKSCAVDQAWLPLPDAGAGIRTRAEGLEGPNHTPRSRPLYIYHNRMVLIKVSFWKSPVTHDNYVYHRLFSRTSCSISGVNLKSTLFRKYFRSSKSIFSTSLKSSLENP